MLPLTTRRRTAGESHRSNQGFEAIKLGLLDCGTNSGNLYGISVRMHLGDLLKGICSDLEQSGFSSGLLVQPPTPSSRATSEGNNDSDDLR